MATFVALLRAVNVGGHAQLSMAGLRESLSGLGYGDVRTYVQSGNVVFEAESGSRQEHAAAIALRIERDFGPRVGVLVLGADDIARVADTNPFAAEPGVDEKWLHATFLFGEAGEADFGEASEAAYSEVWEAAFGRLTHAGG